jgi:hypothetical protein
MALILVDKVLRGNFKQQAPPTPASGGGSKHKRAESTSHVSNDTSSRRHYSLDMKPDFSRGGSRGGPRGGKSGYQGNRDRFPSYPGPSGGSRFNKFGYRSGGGSGYNSRY